MVQFICGCVRSEQKHSSPDFWTSEMTGFEIYIQDKYNHIHYSYVNKKSGGKLFAFFFEATTRWYANTLSSMLVLLFFRLLEYGRDLLCGCSNLILFLSLRLSVGRGCCWNQEFFIKYYQLCRTSFISLNVNRDTLTFLSFTFSYHFSSVPK